ncbi:ATP-binding protein [Flavihumibacter sp. CACIAM 22H1]|uniref:sensor histidine kinase n=1 Tax=Flavihumibacter sp. CACIAM 22H1 TaxID=1812911 RepID=UPI0007A8F1ED|nr:ATP-binding protein [Flavihumibacter sp. CACIAM 22H1]KYP14678.1 MAG: hypothetical protein A1D16_09775 [Flavihumibacter sp. CACIAM 22H1]
MYDKTSEIFIWTIIGSLTTIIAFIIFLNHILRLYNKKSIEFNTQLKLRSLEKEKELLKTRIDVQEETIQKISKELHDNVSQLLTLSKLNLSNQKFDSNIENKIRISKELISNAINELANISRTLSSETLNDLGLVRALEAEKERVYEINKTTINIHTKFDPIELSNEEQLILYRIFQEAISNSIIHGKASQIDVQLIYCMNSLSFSIRDNGKGFEIEESLHGTQNKHHGLKNIMKRAKLINAKCNIASTKGTGTVIEIVRD